MERRTICITLILSLIQKADTKSRIFTCGVINGHPAEYEAMNVALNSTSSFNNISVILKNFSISETTNLVKQVSEFLQQNVVVLVEGSHAKTSACALSTVTGLPIIRLHGNDRPFEQCEKAVQISAGYRDYAHATLDILNAFKWEKIALVFDENGLHDAGYFYAISSTSKLTVNFVQISENGEMEDQTSSVTRAMEQIANLQPEVILLYTSKENIKTILYQTGLCHQRYDYTWILHGQDLIALAYDAAQVFTQAVNRNACLSVNGTDIGPKEKEAMLTCLKRVNLDGATGNIEFNEKGKRTGVELDILNLRNNSFVKIGTWNLTKRLLLFGKILRNTESPSTERSIEGRKFRVVVAETEPFVMMKTQKDGTISYDGYCIDLLKELAEKLRFTYEIYPSPDGMFGAETKNGTWNGMIGELVHKHAHIAISSITITERREKVVDFSLPYMYYTEEMLIKKTNAKIDLLQFLNPFHNDVWLATLATLVIFSTALFLINYCSPYGYKNGNGRGTSQEFSFSNSVWFALGCMLQQGAENTPRNLSGRILAGCYWFCILIFISSYTANLAAFFTVKNVANPINNLEDIVKSSYQVGVYDSSSPYEAFKTSKYDTYQKIWQRIQKEGSIVQSTDEALKLVRERKEFVFIDDGPILRHAANKPPCDLKTVPGLTTAKGFALALQANDPHTKDFTLAILHLHESYFLEKLRRKWWEISHGCPAEIEATLSQKRIDLMSMLGVYAVMSVGIGLAFLALIAETLWKRRKAKQQNYFDKTRWKKGRRSVQVHPGTT